MGFQQSREYDWRKLSQFVMSLQLLFLNDISISFITGELASKPWFSHAKYFFKNRDHTIFFLELISSIAASILR